MSILRTKLLSLCGAWMLCCVASAAMADEPKSKAPADDKKVTDQHASVWMKRKLDFAQNILAGITTADFDQIAQNAESMRSLSKLEGFVRGRTPGYKSQLEVFQDANDELLKQARKENVEGAALAFTQLTISCINCHKHLRSEQAKK